MRSGFKFWPGAPYNEDWPKSEPMNEIWEPVLALGRARYWPTPPSFSISTSPSGRGERQGQKPHGDRPASAGDGKVTRRDGCRALVGVKLAHPVVFMLCIFIVSFFLSAGLLFPPISIAAVKGVGSSDRLALVVGNANYVDLTALDSPVNDARGMAKILRSLNFQVILKTDVDLRSMQEAIKEFAKKAKKGGVALFYYSGHGLQVDLVNYLIPIGGAVKYAEDIPNSSIDANAVLRALSAAKTDFNFVILDACRNNGLERKDKKRVQGLAEMDSPKGTLIAYATGANNVASDGVGGNSLYTSQLLKELDAPGLQVEQIFKRVRQKVLELSLDQQKPVEYTSLTGDFYFRPLAPEKARLPATRDSRKFEVVTIDEEYEALRDVNLRAEPRNQARTVGRLGAREQVRAIGRVRGRDWVKVATREGVQGFTPDYMLRPPFSWRTSPLDATFEALEATTLHFQPRRASRVIAKISAGQKITATGQVVGLNWVRVRIDGRGTAFALKSALQEPFSFKVADYGGAFETTSSVKMLDQPKIGSRQIASLTSRERVTAVGKVLNRNWLKVRRADGLEGFVPESLLSIPFEWREKALESKSYKTVSAAELRAEPRSTARTIATLDPLQNLTVVAKVEDREWLKVELKSDTLGEKKGYVLENLLQLVVARPEEKLYKKGEEFRDCPVCPLMVVIPPDSFVMGSDAIRNTRPTRTVIIGRMFAIGKYEVTFKEWNVCAAEGGCRARPPDGGWGGGNRPVINVSWDDAQEYVRWLTNKTDARYHLPSEAQWEYVARAGSTTQYAWGDNIGSNQANCSDCGSEWGGKRTAPVGSFKPNAFGVHDMHGNIWEWTEDCWHRNYRKAPTDGSAWTTGACRQTVLRGGSFREASKFASSFQRAKYHSAARNNFGFRLARIIGG